jgi:hypothetical protein
VLDIDTPASPTAAPQVAALPVIQPIVPFAPRPRRIQPAGIVARQHQIQAIESDNVYHTQVVEPTLRAFAILADKCVMCWMMRKRDWHLHVSDKCQHRTGTNYGDPEYKSFRSNAFRLERGWCWGCFVHQVGYKFLHFFVCLSYFRRNPLNIHFRTSMIVRGEE